ncbi:hypothetical protein PAESOLCIP111_03868 [Paenibacillus solanacearum]|uniref:Phosphodiester glycosidase domain-containing protein n=1 Tax=Paenibacillus solanacearum TaxID=2048548 RepID=A0A916K3A0_9BACL|nr:phosphodiester glycosidase family protein [Paenibacillus solanacearum]CAG7637685.1 hypothetical protein PAESOLCIP111_03868 [Paenibacillus solanacearum]
MFARWKQKLLIVSLLLLVCTGAVAPSVGRSGPPGEQPQLERRNGLNLAAGAFHETRDVTVETMFRFKDSQNNGNGPATSGSELHNAIYMMEIDANDPNIHLEVVTSGPSVASKEIVTQTAAANDRAGHRVIGAVNGDFFNVANGVPLGLQITDGEVITSTNGKTQTFLAIMPDGSFRIGKAVTIQPALRLTSGLRLDFNGVNKVRNKNLTNHAFLMTDRFGTSTLSEGTGGTEIVIAPVEPGVKLRPGQPVTGVVEQVYMAANNSIPTGKFVITASGSKADWLKQHATVGTSLSFQVDYDQGISSALYVIGGANHRFADVLLDNGEIPVDVKDLLVADNLEHHPRTIVASKGSKLYLIVVDGRQAGYSDGMSVLEAAAYLQSLGMEHAINLDGGGSSTYAVRQPGDTELRVLNRPSDGELRPVANALLVVSGEPENKADGVDNNR